MSNYPVSAGDTVLVEFRDERVCAGHVVQVGQFGVMLLLDDTQFPELLVEGGGVSGCADKLWATWDSIVRIYTSGWFHMPWDPEAGDQGDTAQKWVLKSTPRHDPDAEESA